MAVRVNNELKTEQRIEDTALITKLQSAFARLPEGASFSVN